MARRKRVAILTGGGDVPGLNVAIKAVVVRAAAKLVRARLPVAYRGIDVVALHLTFASLMSPASAGEPPQPSKARILRARLPLQKLPESRQSIQFFQM